MSDQTKNNNQMVVIGLAVVAVLLAAIVGVLVWQQSNSALPAPTATTDTSTDAASTSATTTDSATSGMTGTTSTEDVEFDVETATKVPDGQTPEEFVKAYHEAVAAGDYAKAYEMLPLAKQQSYGSADAYESQVSAYGITGYTMEDPVENGDDSVSIVATQETPQMNISYTWTFKKVDGNWYCASREMAGM